MGFISHDEARRFYLRRRPANQKRSYRGGVPLSIEVERNCFEGVVAAFADIGEGEGEAEDIREVDPIVEREGRVPSVSLVSQESVAQHGNGGVGRLLPCNSEFEGRRVREGERSASQGREGSQPNYQLVRVRAIALGVMGFESEPEYVACFSDSIEVSVVSGLVAPSHLSELSCTVFCLFKVVSIDRGPIVCARGKNREREVTVKGLSERRGRRRRSH